MEPTDLKPTADGDELDADEEAVSDAYEYIDEEAQKRLWIRTLIPLLQMRSHESDPSGRVQLAFDLMHIAACERMARVLRSDLSADGG